MTVFLSPYWILIAAIWFSVNGILHDIFVLRAHKGGYNRELLRLLMDGHVLLLSGAILIVCYFMVRQNISYSYYISLIVSVFMLIYCLMIFPFLKSFVTMGISIMTIIASLRVFLS